MLRCPLIGLLLCCGIVSSAEAKIRMLFVGVDHYAYTVPNLKGTVNDVDHIKKALHDTYGWQVDQPIARSCPTPVTTDTSVTLTNDCATRDAILGALGTLITASSEGDTVLFYYAGHGSQIRDTKHHDQASGWLDTILPYDARDPKFSVPTEIVDEELNVIIQNANRVQGANIVTIFDSCHSATATYAAETGSASREVVRLDVKTLRDVPTLLPRTAKALGYRAHFAAAGDAEIAREVDGVGSGPRAGVFTSALVKAIAAAPNATFADLIEEVKMQIPSGEVGGQHPSASGALNRSFDGKAKGGILVPAQAQLGEVALLSGLLSGISVGSTFALFENETLARDDNTPPLATGQISAVTDARATVKLDAAPAATLPTKLVARERNHAFGEIKVAVRLDVIGSAVRAQVEQALNTIPFATIGAGGQIILSNKAQSDPNIYASAADGAPVDILPPSDDPTFPLRLKEVLTRVARAQALLDLRNEHNDPNLTLCVADVTIPVAQGLECPAAPSTPGAASGFMTPPERALHVNKNVYIAVANNADAPRYVYVLVIDSDFSITLLTPQDAPLQPTQPQRITILLDTPGEKKFIALATQIRINAGVFEQSGGDRDPATCSSALERLLCAANTGSRDATTPNSGAWTTKIVSIKAINAGE